MLTAVERAVFVLLLLAAVYAAYRSADRIIRTIRRGPGALATDHLIRRVLYAMWIFVAQTTVLKRRFLPSLAHIFIAWGFTFYLLVNIGDTLQAFLPGYVFLGVEGIGDVYRLVADVLSIGVLIGMASMLVRRALVGGKVFSFGSGTLLHPKAAFGIKRDSLIVGSFILVHVGSRFLGESFHLVGTPDSWQPFASAVGGLWIGASPDLITLMQHVFFWGAIGTILAFIPYFLYSKHIHIFFAPLNFLLKPQRRSIGELSKIDFDDESITQFGVSRLEHLSQAQLMDAYACIMCNRCQDACRRTPLAKSCRRPHLRSTSAITSTTKARRSPPGRSRKLACSPSRSAVKRCGPARRAARVSKPARSTTSRCATSSTSAAAWC